MAKWKSERMVRCDHRVAKREGTFQNGKIFSASKVMCIAYHFYLNKQSNATLMNILCEQTVARDTTVHALVLYPPLTRR